MSDQPPIEGAGGGDEPFDPLRGLPFFGDLSKMFTGQGPLNWEIARQIAAMVATEGRSEPNVDPADRMAIAELGRVAELRVEAATGLRPNPEGRLELVALRRGGWAQRTLDDYRPILERLADGLDASRREPPETSDPSAALMGGLMGMIGPMMLGMQAGMMIGHLATRSFGQYDLPLPRPRPAELLILVDNVDRFADDWSLPLDEARLWICIHELTHHCVLGRPHVRDHIEHLVGNYVAAFDPDPGALDDRLAGIGPELLAQAGDDPEAVQRALQEAVGDPEVLLGAMQSPRQRELLPQLEAVLAAVVGYVDHVLDEVGPGLISSYGSLTEALRRRRVQAAPGDRFVERLLGLELGQQTYDRGEAFVAGVLERAGAEGLRRLWDDPDALPTPAEIDAPGLWLARIDLPGEG